MSENNEKHQESDDSNPIDYQWEVLKMNNRFVDVLKLIEENSVKIRSNSGRISRVQAELKRVRDGEEEGWEEPEEGGEEPGFQDIDFFNSSVDELQAYFDNRRNTRTR